MLAAQAVPRLVARLQSGMMPSVSHLEAAMAADGIQVSLTYSRAPLEVVICSQ